MPKFSITPNGRCRTGLGRTSRWPCWPFQSTTDDAILAAPTPRVFPDPVRTAWRGDGLTEDASPRPRAPGVRGLAANDVAQRPRFSTEGGNDVGTTQTETSVAWGSPWDDRGSTLARIASTDSLYELTRSNVQTALPSLRRPSIQGAHPSAAVCSRATSSSRSLRSLPEVGQSSSALVEIGRNAEQIPSQDERANFPASLLFVPSISQLRDDDQRPKKPSVTAKVSVPMTLPPKLGLRPQPKSLGKSTIARSTRKPIDTKRCAVTGLPGGIRAAHGRIPFKMFNPFRADGKLNSDSVIPNGAKAALDGNRNHITPNNLETSASADVEDAEMVEKTASMHGRTLGMVDSLQQWISDDKNRTRQQQTKSTEAERRDEAERAELRYVLRAAKEYGLQVQQVREIQHDFKTFDVENNGQIPFESFVKLIRTRAALPPEASIPPHLLGCMQGVDEDASGTISLEEFIQWSVRTAWSEELLTQCPQEREIRELAREQSMLLPDVERIKKMFDEFDTDGSGEIEEGEFRDILYKLLKVKNLSDVPDMRLKRYWREVDMDGSGAIVFKEFLIWYKNSFATEGGFESFT
eukprot:TRINITY_DN62921_c0_g1_i1.p1 TRINITY_DN62921_c0_g1~~TRINITY_DN62921_c0_g1_i1.p1  ORF type:complete len:580 (-),score=78.00 TRINITY_DN62921_c0_g1_i1:253-1992(-)